MHLPTGRNIIVHVHRVYVYWHAKEPALNWETASDLLKPDHASLNGRIAHLGLINCFQWHLEDACRDNPTSYPVLGRLKLKIDRSNQRRVECIDALDELCLRELRNRRPEPEQAPPTLFTPGNLIDQLSILELKRFHAEQRFQSSSPDTNMLSVLEMQSRHLCEGFDRLMDDLMSGRLRLPLYTTVKLYGAR